MARVKVTSERMRELGKLGAAKVARDPVTKRFRKRDPAPEPPTPEPATQPAPEPDAPSFSEARRLLHRLRRRADR